MMNSLINKWNGWGKVRRLDLKFGDPKLISDKGLELVRKIDEFIKKKYPKIKEHYVIDNQPDIK